MDHKWGRNVIDIGMVSSGCTLCSRFVGSPNLIITNRPTGFTNQCTAWVYLADVQKWDGPLNLGIVGHHPRFPYGFNVEPDEPV